MQRSERVLRGGVACPEESRATVVLHRVLIIAPVPAFAPAAQMVFVFNAQSVGAMAVYLGLPCNSQVGWWGWPGAAGQAHGGAQGRGGRGIGACWADSQ